MAVAFAVMTAASYVVARLYVSSFRIFATTAVSFFVDALGATSGFGQSVYFFLLGSEADLCRDGAVPIDVDIYARPLFLYGFR